MRATLRRLGPRFLFAGSLSGMLACALDLLAGGHFTAWGWVLALGCAALVGFVGALVPLTALAMVRHVVGRTALMMVLALIVATHVALELGVFERLGGVHHDLALVALFASLGFGTLLALGTLLGVHTLRDNCPARTRGLIAGAAIVVAVSAMVADRSLGQLQGYPVAQAALRVSSLFGVGIVVLASSSLWQRGAVPAFSMGVSLCCVVGAALCPPDATRTAALTARPFCEFALQRARGLTDLDGDGSSHLFGGGDCSAFDPQVHPRAAEIAGNGIDDNCRGGDAELRAGSALAEVDTADSPSPADVILITVDSLRPDFLSLYGYPDPTSPGLQRWSESSVRFDNAYASAGWTSMSLASLFRGVYARRIHWTRVYESTQSRLLRDPTMVEVGQKILASFILPLDDGHPTLAELLHRRGMHTAAVVDDGPSEFLSPSWGSDRGYDTYLELNPGVESEAGDRQTTDRAIETLAKLDEGGKSYFLWVHYFGPHVPSEFHDGAATFGSPDREHNRYAHEIAHMDAELRRFLDAVDEARGERDQLVILLSDHGETVEKRARYHGNDALEHTLRIPLLWRGPKSKAYAGTGLSRTVHMVDVMPTILRATATPPPSGLDGRDLADQGEPRVMFSDVWRFSARGEPIIDQVAAYDGRHKLVLDQMQQAVRTSEQQGGKDVAVDPEQIPSQSRLRGELEAYLESAQPIPQAWSP